MSGTVAGGKRRKAGKKKSTKKGKRKTQKK
jgi:hypothetical protein